MVKRKLIWSHTAKIKLFEILDYFRGRNNTSTYSQKLYTKIIREVSVLIKHPEIGLKTDLNDVRCLIIENYMVFYETSETSIIIHTIWDSHQNPENLKIK